MIQTSLSVAAFLALATFASAGQAGGYIYGHGPGTYPVRPYAGPGYRPRPPSTYYYREAPSHYGPPQFRDDGLKAQPIRAAGSVHVEVDPPSAVVTLNGQRLPTDGGVGELGVLTGQHTVRISAAGYKSETHTVSVQAGAVVELIVALSPSR